MAMLKLSDRYINTDHIIQVMFDTQKQPRGDDFGNPTPAADVPVIHLTLPVFDRPVTFSHPADIEVIRKFLGESPG